VEALAAAMSKKKTSLDHPISTRARRCSKQRFVYDSDGFGKINQILPGTTARPQDETGAIYLPRLYLTINEMFLNRNKEYLDTLAQA
jgi:hypothetical protein